MRKDFFWHKVHFPFKMWLKECSMYNQCMIYVQCMSISHCFSATLENIFVFATLFVLDYRNGICFCCFEVAEAGQMRTRGGPEFTHWNKLHHCLNYRFLKYTKIVFTQCRLVPLRHPKFFWLLSVWVGVAMVSIDKGNVLFCSLVLYPATIAQSILVPVLPHRTLLQLTFTLALMLCASAFMLLWDFDKKGKSIKGAKEKNLLIISWCIMLVSPLYTIR